MKVLVVDNRDSFVFNLTEDLARLGAECIVVRGGISLEKMHERMEMARPDMVLLSPGPGHPDDGGVMMPFLQEKPKVPVLGICLGMQAMVCALGGQVGRAPRPAHARISRITHSGAPIFDGIEGGFRAGRYHSLAALEIPEELEAIAWTEDSPGEEPLVMAVRHGHLPWWGLQFHPESVLSPRGTEILANVMNRVRM